MNQMSDQSAQPTIIQQEKSTTKSFIGGITGGVLGIIIGLVILLLCCCLTIAFFSSNSNNQPEKVGSIEETSNTNTPNSTENNQTNKTPEDFFIGDEVKLGDHIITVHGIEFTSEELSSFYTPESGNRFLIIDVEVSNVGSENDSTNPNYFTLSDSKGFTYDYEWFGKDPIISSDPIRPNGKVRGYLTFEVSAQEDIFELTYTPSWLSNNTAVIKLQNK